LSAGGVDGRMATTSVMAVQTGSTPKSMTTLAQLYDRVVSTEGDDIAALQRAYAPILRHIERFVLLSLRSARARVAAVNTLTRGACTGVF
jgi:hypothetical protein